MLFQISYVTDGAEAWREGKEKGERRKEKGERKMTGMTGKTGETLKNEIYYHWNI
jgi:hypothetical protein